MMVLKVIVVDDEPLAINVIKNYVAQVKNLDLVATFSNAVEVYSYLRAHDVDIIFLDIDMPLLNGLDFLASLKVKPMVVITTAHEEYALKSFDLEAIDYLVKPVPFPRFLKAVNRIMNLRQPAGVQESNQHEKPHVFVKIDKKKLQKIYLDEITVIESLKDYIRIKTCSNKYIIHKTLGSFTNELPAGQFIRIHRSHTVSVNKVRAVEGNSLEVDGVRYTIGRSYIEEVKKRILNNSIT